VRTAGHPDAVLVGKRLQEKQKIMQCNTPGLWIDASHLNVRRGERRVRMGLAGTVESLAEVGAVCRKRCIACWSGSGNTRASEWMPRQTIATPGYWQRDDLCSELLAHMVDWDSPEPEDSGVHEYDEPLGQWVLCEDRPQRCAHDTVRDAFYRCTWQWYVSRLRRTSGNGCPVIWPHHRMCSRSFICVTHNAQNGNTLA